MIRRISITWRRARRTGRDLDLAAYACFVLSGVALLAALSGVLGPTLDAQSTLTACEGCGKTAVAARQP
ncbi:hypothetical protein KDH83_28655 [Achromobacter sp. Marseille-Q0513]|uniref:hypothetical protein n=1 Tax=Achromobacter sp. Marseille-Q0513 TaxID=2829161 RepID=UPI001B927458|nr:hypothetical protein [Achromobacter sp. Marseille-Q0513]MBR8657294.1 hypothetical protein [Achromobacter sp. Marseille-Q0513]